MREDVQRRTKRKLKKNGAIFLKGIIDFFICQLTNLVSEKKPFMSLADLKSAIEDDNGLRKVKKVVSATFLLVCFLGLNESSCQTRETSQTCFSSSSINVKKKKNLIAWPTFFTCV